MPNPPKGGDGPMFFYGTEFKVAVTANGVLVVEKVPEEPSGSDPLSSGRRFGTDSKEFRV